MIAKTLTENSKIWTFARWAEWGCMFGLALVTLVVGATLVSVVAPSYGFDIAQALEVDGVSGPLSLGQRAVAGLFWLSTDLVGAVLFYTGVLLFRGIAEGDLYMPHTATRVRRLGWLILSMAPVGILSESLGSGVMSAWTSNWQSSSVSLSLGDTEVYAVVIGLILVCFGHILTEAAEVAAENQSFV